MTSCFPLPTPGYHLNDIVSMKKERAGRFISQHGNEGYSRVHLLSTDIYLCFARLESE